MFSYMENWPQDLRQKFGVGGYYGTPVKNMAETLSEAGESYDLVMPSLHLHTAEQAIKEVEKLFDQVFDGVVT
jgi:hypothetical protein